MKQKKGQKFRKVLTFAMSVIMVVETINCVSMTASASDGITVSAGDAIELNQTLENQVNEAESAAVAADEAAKAAEEALKAAEQLAGQAGDAALETANDGTYTETVKDVSGNDVEVPVLKDELDDAITEAENKVEEANNANGDIIDTTQTEIDGLAAQAVTDTADQLKLAEDAADDAEAAAQKAQDELAKAQAAGDYYTAQKAAKAAEAAYKTAQAAADEAGKAYEDAKKILEAAQKAVDEAIAACDVSTGDAINTAQGAIDDAQAALNAADAIVAQAETEYSTAKSKLDAAKAAADEAARKADEIADGIEGDLEKTKGVDVDTLSAQRDTAKEDLVKAENDKVLIDQQQDAIIKKATEDKAAADAKINEYNAANSLVDDMEDKGFLGLGTSEISELRKLASKTTSDVKEYKWFRPVYYKQSEIDAAKAKVAEYEAAKNLINNTDINAIKQASANAQNQINSAYDAKNAATNAITNKMTEIAGLEASIATVTDYIYNNPDADVYDLADNQAYKDLMAEMKASNEQYDESVDAREEYQDVTNRNWKNVYDSIKKLLKELKIEYDENGDYFNWRTLSFDTEYGKLTLIPGHNTQNVTTLINIENGKLTVAKVDELEFATYAATFDAVAAAESAQKAAEAAQKEKEAKDKLDAAKLALELAQERLNAAKLKKLNLKNAKLALAEAEKNVDLSKKEWEDAKKSAEEAKKAADEAKVLPETKPVTAAFYVLNRSLSQPDEVNAYPKSNYSKKPIYGELYSGVLDETTGNRDYSYIALYKKGIKDEASVPNYIAVAPTTEQLAEAGVVLKEGETIKWYVIKTQGDGYHVDGFIVNQKFNINVLYGYKDAGDHFVEFTKADGTTYAQGGTFVLGDTYEFDSPVIDDYVMETAKVTGTASTDLTIEVVYTKEATAPVKINYYRGSIAGTLLESIGLNVALSKLEGYGETIKTNWLNKMRPTDCNNGVLVSYYFDEAEGCYVGKVVYSPITTPKPTPVPGPTPTPVVEDAPIVTVNEEPTPTTVRTIRPATPAVEEENEEDVVVVPEEDTPLADAPVVNEDTTGEDQEVVNIEEEETPLAAGQNCWLHWLILIITAAYTLYELVRCVMRNKKIREISESRQSVEA